MATSVTGNKDAAADVSDIKRKLAWRMGIAGLMIVALLGGLALFDYMGEQGTTESSAPPQFTEPVPVAKKLLTQPVTPAEPAPEAVKDDKKVAEPESTAAPVDKSAQRSEPPPRPEIAAQPALPRALPPAARSAASGQPVAPAPVKPVEAKAAMPAVPVPASIPPPPQPVLSRLLSGYTLQAGVFSDPRRAEELHARLVLEGIPSSIEARVQVGPFKNKDEAEAAREKMKSLGIEAVMLPPKGARR